MLHNALPDLITENVARKPTAELRRLEPCTRCRLNLSALCEKGESDRENFFHDHFLAAQTVRVEGVSLRRKLCASILGLLAQAFRLPL